MRTELEPIIEKGLQVASIGLVTLALSGCWSVPPADGAYYEPWSNHIHYPEGVTPEPKIVIHEESHKRRANEYPDGRFIWALRYETDPIFRCNEERASNKESLITLPHPACEGIDLPTSPTPQLPSLP